MITARSAPRAVLRRLRLGLLPVPGQALALAALAADRAVRLSDGLVVDA
jgi:hypothetical protein